MRKLIAGFDNAHPGRGYYGKQQGWKTGNQVKLLPDKEFPQYSSVSQMVNETVDELIATAAIKKQGFGGLWHIINHGGAIAELDRLGYKKIATLALPAQHHHIRLWRTLPDVESELGPMVKSELDPRDPIYWRGMLKRYQARLTHRIKTLYGFSTLKPYIENPATLKQAEGAFLYLMG